MKQGEKTGGKVEKKDSPQRVRMTVEMPREDYINLRRVANGERVSVSAYIRQMVIRAVREGDAK